MTPLMVEQFSEFLVQIIPLMFAGSFLSGLLALMVFHWLIQPVVRWVKS